MKSIMKRIIRKYISEPYRIVLVWISIWIRSWFSIYLFAPIIYLLIGTFASIYCSWYINANSEIETVWKWQSFVGVSSYFLAILMFVQLKIRNEKFYIIFPFIWVTIFLTQFIWCAYLWITYFQNSEVIVRYTTLYEKMWEFLNFYFWSQIGFIILVPIFFIIFFLSAVFIQIQFNDEDTELTARYP